MTKRYYLAAFVFALAGIIHSPFFPQELSPVPAHSIYFSAIGAAQLMWAIALVSNLWRVESLIWPGVLLSGGDLIITALSAGIDMPFTNIGLSLTMPFALLLGAELIALVILLTCVTTRQQVQILIACAALGSLLWGTALMSETYLPDDLAHNTIDQFAVYEQVNRIDPVTGYEWALPAGFPVPLVPEDNPMTLAKVALGRFLFYDIRLSGNNTMSCSSCHMQALAFSDGLTVPTGSTGQAHTRNSQSLTNAAYNATYTWGNPVLTQIEQQVIIPLFGEFPVEMGVTGNEDIVLERLRDDASYQQMFTDAFPDEADPITIHSIVQSLSSFVRTMISGNSAYDRFVYQADYDALSESAIRGMDMFLSEKFECHHCHGGFNFTLSTVHANTTFAEQPFFNTGLYNTDSEGSYPRGNRGVFEITSQVDDMGRFRPQTLRNIDLTAPYMHDGSIETLEAVIDFYANGGRVIEDGPNAGDGRDNPYKSGFVPGFDITEQEKADLIAFLKSLTDDTFITDARFSDPFKE